MRDAAAALGEEVEVGLGRIHHVRGDEGRSQEPRPVGQFDGGAVVLTFRPCDLVAGFGEVHLHGQPGSVGPVGDPPHHFRAGGIGRMGRGGGGDPRVPGEAVGQCVEPGEAFVHRAVIGGGEVGQRLPDDPAQTGVVEDVADQVFEVVHVGDGRDPAPDRFEGAEAGADLDHFGVDQGPLQRQDVAKEPVVDVFAQGPGTGSSAGGSGC
jgi:hypothetical protein